MYQAGKRPWHMQGSGTVVARSGSKTTPLAFGSSCQTKRRYLVTSLWSAVATLPRRGVCPRQRQLAMVAPTWGHTYAGTDQRSYNYCARCGTLTVHRSSQSEGRHVELLLLSFPSSKHHNCKYKIQIPITDTTRCAIRRDFEKLCCVRDPNP